MSGIYTKSTYIDRVTKNINVVSQSHNKIDLIVETLMNTDPPFTCTLISDSSPEIYLSSTYHFHDSEVNFDL